MLTVINLYAGPCVGKSTCAAQLFCVMKKRGLNVELVTEYAKDLVYETRHNVLRNDQNYVLAKQFRKLYRLSSVVDVVITDSPLMMSCVYFCNNETYQPITYDTFHRLNMEMNANFNNINFFLTRNSELPYSSTGRYQSIEEAKELDIKILNFLKEENLPFKEVVVGMSHTESFILNESLQFIEHSERI